MNSLQWGVETHPYTPERERIRNLLRSLRREAGLRQEDLAKRLNKPQSFVSRFESGERRLDLPELNDVCRELGVSLAGFVQRYEASTDNNQ